MEGVSLRGNFIVSTWSQVRPRLELSSSCQHSFVPNFLHLFHYYSDIWSLLLFHLCCEDLCGYTRPYSILWRVEAVMLRLVVRTTWNIYSNKDIPKLTQPLTLRFLNITCAKRLHLIFFARVSPAFYPEAIRRISYSTNVAQSL